jgi:predicted small secreted protein
MKKRLIFAIILLFIVLTGCGNDVKGEADIKGVISEVEDQRILVEDEKLGLIWLSLPDESDSKTFEKGQTVAVWTDGKVRESYPLQGTALHVEIRK